MCESQLSLVAPCQCLTPLWPTSTSPLLIRWAGFPSSWYQPSPAVTNRIWKPFMWMCQLLRHPGSKDTLATCTGMLASATNGDMKLSPEKYCVYASFGELTVCSAILFLSGCVVTRLKATRFYCRSCADDRFTGRGRSAGSRRRQALS